MAVAPDFWQRRGMPARLLAPLAALFGVAGAARRRWSRPERAGVPVICVGNLVAGGAGKTPVALALLDLAARIGVMPHVLTRGYGGSLAGPVAVDRDLHDAGMVGDEALLLAVRAPTWLARDRRAGAAAAVAAGAAAIVMDDGMQNPGLHHDWNMLVVDGGYGFGNGMLMPAGPLRESIAAGVSRATFAVVVGEDRHGAEAMLRGRLPVLRATLVPQADREDWAGRRVVAFAGIGRPAKFFATLEALGADIVAAEPFPDHHAYRREQIAALQVQATATGSTLVTTEKDWVRLSPELRAEVGFLPVTLVWERQSEVTLMAALAGLLGRGL